MENNKINPSSEDGNNSALTAILSEQEDELHYAILSGNIDLVKSLLEKPETDVNTFAKSSPEDFGFEEFYTSEVSPLFVAIKKHNLEVVKLLVNHPKIDINLGSTLIYRNRYKMTPLIFALAPIISCDKPVKSEDKNSLIEIAKVLLNHPNIDVNAHFLDGTTPFQAAVRENCPEIVELLIDRPEINVNDPARYLGNRTPLEYVLRPYSTDLNLVKILLRNKDLDLNTKNADGKSPFDLVFERIYLVLGNEKKTAEIAKAIFARKMQDIEEKTEDIKEKQNKMLEQKKILENKREELILENKRRETSNEFFKKISIELSAIDELMEEYFPKNKSKCNIF